MISRLIEFIQDWIFIFQRQGWRAAILTMAHEVAQLPYRHMHFVIVARSLTLPLPDLHSKIVLEIRDFTWSDTDLVRQIDRPSEARLCARRLEHGQVGLAAFHDDQLAGYAWASDKIVSSLERVNLHLELYDAICVDAYTAPAFRGLGVQTALALARFRLLRDRGFQRMVTYIEEGNAPSLAVWQKKLGSQVVGHIDFLRIGPWRWVRYIDADL
jgi:GNAT superfamily N-acetyltransferase